MKQPAILLAVLFFLKTPLAAQTFNGTGGLLVPPGAPSVTTGTTISNCDVSGVGVLGGCKKIDKVTINLNHTWDGELGIFLIGPGGQVLELSTGNGGGNDNYSNTMFTDNAPTFITAGAPPFAGTFRPEGRQTSLTPPYSNAPPLGTFTFANTFDGTDADGTWQLYINDFLGADWGTLISWSITFSGSGPGLSASLTATPTPICAGATGQATLKLTFSGATPAGTTYNVVIAAAPGGNLNYSNITPTGTVWTVNIPLPTATTTYTLTSITSSAGCPPTVGSPSEAEIVVVPIPMAAISGDLSICNGESTELTGSGGGTYHWSTGSNSDVITVSPTSNQTYSLTVTSDVGGCTATASVPVVVHPKPAISLAAPPNICDGGCKTVTATLMGTAPFNFTWEIQSGGDPIGPGGSEGGNGSPILFQACVPPGSGPTVQVVVCSLSDQFCNL